MSASSSSVQQSSAQLKPSDKDVKLSIVREDESGRGKGPRGGGGGGGVQACGRASCGACLWDLGAPQDRALGSRCCRNHVVGLEKLLFYFKPFITTVKPYSKTVH